MTKTTKKQTKKQTKNHAKRTPPKAKAMKQPKAKALVAGPGEIVVTNGHGPTLIKAETVHEFFAIHTPVDPPKVGHALTHVPTGRRISTYRTRALAAWVAGQLRAMGGAELWAFTDPNHMLKSQPKDVLDKLRRLADPVSAKQEWLASAPLGKAAKAPKVTTPPPSTDPAAPKYSAPWRSGVDWVAAGKKAYETRQRNLAARQAEAAAAAAAAAATPVKRRAAGARA